jgi:lipopolysaccharide export system protein LptA
MKKKIIISFFFLFLLIIIYISKKYQTDKISEVKIEQNENLSNSNIIKNLKHISKDTNGNEYTINAEEGEIDFNDNSVIFLKNVNATIRLKNNEEILISSKLGKYNINTYDTVFSKMVVINYLENKITGEYLNFSLKNNLMTISKNVIYENQENIMKSDVIEMDIKSKDTKVFMQEKDKNVNIKSKF